MSIKLRAIAKSYKKKRVFSGVSFVIPDGAFLVVKGECGSGKTTLLNIIAGITKPKIGAVTVSGYDLSSMKKHEKKKFYRNTISYIPRGLSLHPKLNIRDNISLPGVFANYKCVNMKARINNISRKFALEDILKKKPKDITEEQRRRVCIARACFIDPKIILADEPTDGLDKKDALIVVKFLAAIAKENNAIVIMTTKDDIADKFATKIVEFKGGKLVDAETEKTK